MKKSFGRLISLLLAMILSVQVMGVFAAPAERVYKHTIESYQAVSGFIAVEDSYHLNNGKFVEDNNSSGVNFGTTFIYDQGNMVIYKIPVPAYRDDRDVGRFIFRVGYGDAGDIRIMKIDGDKWDFSKFPQTISKTDPRIAPLISKSSNPDYCINDADIVKQITGQAYDILYADITGYARECYAKGMTHMYIAAGAWNSTRNFALASMTDTTYRGQGLYPGYYYNYTSPYSDKLFEYPDISAEKFEELIEDVIDQGHPYIFGRQEDFDRIKEYAFGKDAAMTEMYQRFKDKAAQYVDKAVSAINYDIVNTSYLSRASDALNIILHCAFVYMVEGDTDYADRALAEAMYFAENMETWGRAQSLDCNHAALGIAICYDWLYNYMTEHQRAVIGDSMYTKHLNELYDFFLHPSDPKYKWSFHQMYLQSNNHAVLDNTSAFVQALAVCEVNPVKAATVMSYALKHLCRDNGPFDRLYPDAGWYEGSSYWSYVGPFIARMFSAMESAFGTTFGFEEMPYITDNSYFPIYTQSRRNRLVYSDSTPGTTNSSFFYYLGHMSGDEALQKYTIDNLFCSDPVICLWYDPAELTDSKLTLDKDKRFRAIDVATMRSSWDNPQELYTGMAVQKPSETHGFMAMGTFALDAFDEIWVTNPGKEAYSIGDYWDNGQNGVRWTYYSTRAEANSCLVINPGTDGGQLVKSPDGIDVMKSSDEKAYMVSDMSCSYEGVNSYKRGLMIYDRRSRVLLQDEISLKEASDVYSFINVYKADIDIASDGSYAILSKGNKHIYVKIISDKPYELVTYEACSSALGTSPNPSGQTDFTTDFERLAVRYDDVSGDINLTVIFVPFLSDVYPEIYEKQTPISNWSVEDDGEAKPQLTSLCIDGKPVDGFRGDVNYYCVPMKYPEAKIDAVADGYDISVKNNYKDNCFDILVTDRDGGVSNHYCIEYILLGEVVADTSVGGSVSSDSHYLNKNYGKDTTVTLRHMDTYMIMAYYKLKLPFIPAGKNISNVSLVLNQYRNTNSANKDSYEFHITNPDDWDEYTITYNNAPVRHTYTKEWYPYKRRGADGSYSVVSNPDISTGYLDIKTVPSRYGANDRFYAEHTYDVTPLVDAMDFSSVHSYDNILSYAMGHYIIGKYGSSARTTIASKEHPNESLRPRVEVQMESDDTMEGIVAHGPKVIADPTGDELFFSSSQGDLLSAEKLSAVAYAINFDDEKEENINIFLAQYDTRGKLVGITQNKISVPAGEAVTVRTDIVDVADGAVNFKSFTWTDKLVPADFDD